MIKVFTIKSVVQSFLRLFGVQLYRLPTQEEIKKQKELAAEAERIMAEAERKKHCG